jgi:lysophospholipase L1-like esterase
MADAPLILDDDFLDDAYPKMNQGIRNANEALNGLNNTKEDVQKSLALAAQSLPAIATKNLFDKRTAKYGKYISWIDGLEKTPSDSNWYASDFINVLSRQAYTIAKMNQLAFYNANKEYISGVDNGSNSVFTVTTPEGCAYIRLTTRGDLIDLQQVELGTQSTEYTPHLFLDVETLPFPPIEGENGRNLFNKAKITPGKYVRWDSGTIGSNENYSLSEYMPAIANTSYAVNFGDQLAFFDINKNYLGGVNNNNNPDQSATFVTPGNTRYILMSIPNAKVDTAQLELGTKSTDYEEYKVVLPTKYFDVDTMKAIENAKLLPDKQYKTIQSIFRRLWNTSGLKIKFIGDSITQGVGGTGYAQDGEVIFEPFRVNTKGYCWANLLKNYLESKFNCTVKNWGTSGRTSYDLLQHITRLIESDDDIIICMIGTNNRNNEYRDGVLNSQEGLYNDLIAIADYVKGLGKEIIFMSSVPASIANETDDKLFHMEDVDTIIMSAAAHYNMEYISLYKKMLNYCEMKDVTIDSFLDDGLHPNDEGYLVMFNFVCDALGIGRKRADATW